MTLSLQPLVQRLAAVALLVAVAGLGWLAVVQPLANAYQRQRAEIAHTQSLLARYERLGDARAALEARLAELEDRQAAGRRVLTAASPSLAAAQLQNDVKELVGRHGGDLKSTQVIAGDREGPFRKITLRASMDADLTSLQRIFHGLEASHVYRFLDNVEIRARLARRRTEATSVPTMLDVRFDVFAYLREEEAK